MPFPFTFTSTIPALVEQLKALIDDYAWYYNNERHQWDRERMTPVRYEEYLLSLDEESFNEYISFLYNSKCKG